MDEEHLCIKICKEISKSLGWLKPSIKIMYTVIAPPVLIRVSKQVILDCSWVNIRKGVTHYHRSCDC